MRARVNPRALTAALLVSLVAGRASASDYRRPGLEGAWSERHLTAPMNSLRVNLGPGQPTFLGERMGNQIVDGGAQFIRPNGTDPAFPAGDQWWLRAGIGFGLTEDWEVGVLFLPFQFAPDVHLSNVAVAITRGFRFASWDLGLRLSFLAPSLKAYDLGAWNFNPGVPVVVRSGMLRFDGGVFVPIATSDGSVGMNVPLRGSVSLTPRFFVGLQSGVFDPRFTRGGDLAVPLGALAGYTELLGSKVVDVTAEVAWDDFWMPSPARGRDTLQLDQYRVGFGLVFHTLVR
jgi:hypothetical protein